MSAKWGSGWVRLYQNPSLEWRALSYSTRGLGYDILCASASNRGRIECGTKPPFDVVALLCAIAPLDRRRARKDFEALLVDGFIVLEGTTIVVRNFERAQETKTEAAVRKAAQRAREAGAETPSADHDHSNDKPTTNTRRPANKHSSSGEQTATIQTDATQRKDSHELVTVTPLLEETKTRKRLEEKREEIVSTSQKVETAAPVEPAPTTKEQLSLTPAEPKAKAKRPDPLPFPVYTGLQAIAEKTQRFALPAQPELSKGHVIALAKQVRRFPKLEEWALVGEYLNANGEGWRSSLNVSYVASSQFAATVATARAWEKRGRPAMDRKGNELDPTKGPSQAWSHARMTDEEFDSLVEVVKVEDRRGRTATTR